MAHNGHFMQTRLSVEKHKISIVQMPFNLVAKLQMMITALLQIPEIKPLTIISNYVLGTSLTGRWMGAIVHELFQPFNVIGCHSLRICEIQCYTPRNSQLINVNSRIWSNDSTC
uniref:Uncharacterized protein n=1 Tax=Opuntia streptacantha TaxID=393608 RepID=A0A7C9CZE7_OPUST